jgi:hypothetical protein
MKKSLIRKLSLLLLVLAIPLLNCDTTSSSSSSKIIAAAGLTAGHPQEKVDIIQADTKAIALQAVYSIITSIPMNKVVTNLSNGSVSVNASSNLIILLDDKNAGLKVQLNTSTGKLYIVMDGFALLLGAGMYGTIVGALNTDTIFTDGHLSISLYTEQPLTMTKKWDDATGLLDIPLDLSINMCIDLSPVFKDFFKDFSFVINPATLCGLSGAIKITLNLNGSSTPITIPLFTGESTACEDLQGIIDGMSCKASDTLCQTSKNFWNGLIGKMCN